MQKRDVGRLVTKALRHRPQLLNLHLDKAGYCNVDELIKGLNLYGYEADKNLIEEIGKNERFSFNEKHTKIRADYGNSIGLKLSDMYETNDIPPEVLYHGTSYDAIESIKRNGIVRFAKIGKARDHIFLTEQKDVALKKGNRLVKLLRCQLMQYSCITMVLNSITLKMIFGLFQILFHPIISILVILSMNN